MFFIRFLVFNNEYAFINKETLFLDWKIYWKFYKEKEYPIPSNPDFVDIEKILRATILDIKEG